MEHPHNLLTLVLKQHYHHRPEVLENANLVIQEYKDNKNGNYEKTLTTLYEMLNDLPPDILLYYLTTVPLPKIQEIKSNSVLMGLMKQMLGPTLHNSMRPILLNYLNDQVPPLIPITNSKTTKEEPNNDNDQENNEHPQLITTNTSKTDEKGESKTDENKNIKQENENSEDEKENSIIDKKKVEIVKNENKINVPCVDDTIAEDSTHKKAKKQKLRVLPKKNYHVKSLATLCATNIYKNHNLYVSKYRKQRQQAWSMVNNTKCSREKMAVCYDVINDMNKKIKWLAMFSSGNVPLDIIREEYGKSDVFFHEKRFKKDTNQDILDISPEIVTSINVFLDKC